MEKTDRKWHVSYNLKTGTIRTGAVDLVDVISGESEQELKEIGVATIDAEFIYAGMNIRECKIYTEFS